MVPMEMNPVVAEGAKTSNDLTENEEKGIKHLIEIKKKCCICKTDIHMAVHSIT